MADRIGVISKGEIILVEDKAALMEKLGKKQLTLQLQQPLAGRARRARPATARAVGRRRASSIYTFDAKARADRDRRPAAASSASSASTSRICRPARARSRRSSSAW